MKLHEKITTGGILGIVGGIAIHVISDMFFTSNKYGIAILIIGFCALGAGQMIEGRTR